jgi:hypothetical protein
MTNVKTAERHVKLLSNIHGDNKAKAQKNINQA